MENKDEIKDEVRDVMLTTIDNPFNPFEDFDKWYAWDESHGYHTCAVVARMLQSSRSFSDEDQARDLEAAIDQIVELNITGTYKKLIRDW